MTVEVRLRGDVMTREDMDTGNSQLAGRRGTKQHKAQGTRPRHGLRRASGTTGERATMDRPTYSDSDPSGRRGRHRRDGCSRCPWRRQDGGPQTRGRGRRELEGFAASGDRAAAGAETIGYMYRICIVCMCTKLDEDMTALESGGCVCIIVCMRDRSLEGDGGCGFRNWLRAAKLTMEPSLCRMN